ncbi:MAG: phosphoribosylformylglycinamidine synthase I [Acidimicrobiia bacterium]
MKTAVVVFPGTNCEHDVAYALRAVGADPELVWHRESDLSDFDGVVLPGGFAHGDYLRTGAIARFSPVMVEVARLATEGRPVLGICNGFQILCEAGLLPGALIQNQQLRFICRPVHVRVASTESMLTRSLEVGAVLQLPLNSYEGNYTAPDFDLNSVVLQYCSPTGQVTPSDNPNGAIGNTAAVTNETGNVVGIMPHPERAIESALGSRDGRLLLEGMLTALSHA